MPARTALVTGTATTSVAASAAVLSVRSSRLPATRTVAPSTSAVHQPCLVTVGQFHRGRILVGLSRGQPLIKTLGRCEQGPVGSDDLDEHVLGRQVAVTDRPPRLEFRRHGVRLLVQVVVHRLQEGGALREEQPTLKR